MTTLFSDPDVQGITLWGFWEQADWKPDAALWRTNWEIKPAGQALVNLLKHEWTTDETFATDSNGEIATRGFLGHYTIEVSKGEATLKTEVDITKTSPRLIIKIPAATN
jgi:endo-1,4-beta-xylanase